MSHSDICSYLDKAMRPRPPLQANRSWQSEQNLHQLPFFSRLTKLFESSCEQVLLQQNMIHHGLEVTGCWCNVAPPGSLHTPHMHPNNFLSGVYYPRVQKGANTIVFHDHNRNQSAINPAVIQLNEYNAAEVAVALKTGSLVIFPSTLMHSVPPNQSQSERFSISFNVMFKAFSEKISPPQWQGIKLNT